MAIERVEMKCRFNMLSGQFLIYRKIIVLISQF